MGGRSIMPALRGARKVPSKRQIAQKVASVKVTAGEVKRRAVPIFPDPGA
jgi:hypothetical protein